MGLIACLAGHGNAKKYRWGAIKGANIWWVARNYGDGHELIWPLLKMACRRAWKDKNETRMCIRFFGGGSVTVKSGDDPDSLRQQTLDGVVFDEAAMQSQENWNTLMPTLGVRGGWAWFISTPKGENWFHDLYKSAGMQEDWQAWNSPTTTETMPQHEIDRAREQIGSYAFRQEYLAEFVSPGGGFFKRDQFRYYTNGGGTYKLGDRVFEVDKCRRFCTVDLAASTKTSADYTVVSTFAESPNKDLIVLDVQRVRMEGPDQVPLIRRCFEKWNPSKIKIESVAYQLSLIQQARRDGLPVSEIKRDKDKVSRACFLQARMEGGGCGSSRELHGFEISRMNSRRSLTGSMTIRLTLCRMVRWRWLAATR